MDIYCKHCGEPWDQSELHDMADATGDYEKPLAYDDARDLFYAHGCGAFQNHPPTDCNTTPIVPPESLASIYALQYLLGDDTDGLASMLEDARYTGMIEL